MLTTRRKLDGRGAAKRRRVMILRASWNVDDDRFSVAADVNPIDLALPCSRITVQRRADGDSHRARAADARTVRSLGIAGKCKAALRLKEFDDLREQREPVTLSFHKRGKRRKALFQLGVSGDELDPLVPRCMRLNYA